MLIRRITSEDYPQATDIHNAQNEPHWQTTPEQMQRSDEVKRRSDPHYRRYVAEEGGVVATGYLTPTWAGTTVAGRVWTGIFTRAQYRNKGVDTRLLEHALTHSSLSVQEVWSCVRSDFVPMSGYLTGFGERFRSFGAELDLSRVDITQFVPLVKRLETKGVIIKPYADLSDDSERDEKLLALHAKTEADAPHHEPIIPQRHLDICSAKTDQSSVFVAVHNGRYVGYVGLEKSDSDKAGLSFLGVSRPYRNQGVGTGLGARVTRHAKSKYTKLGTGGAKENVATQCVLRKLGFEIEPEWMTFSKTL